MKSAWMADLVAAFAAICLSVTGWQLPDLVRRSAGKLTASAFEECILALSFMTCTLKMHGEVTRFASKVHSSDDLCVLRLQQR